MSTDGTVERILAEVRQVLEKQILRMPDGSLLSVILDENRIGNILEELRCRLQWDKSLLRGVGQELVQVPRAALKWIVGWDTGMSSVTLWAYMVGVEPAWVCHPLDADDLGRCIRLLQAVPEWRKRLHYAAALSPEWAALVAIWDELERLYMAGELEECNRRLEAAVAGGDGEKGVPRP